MISYYTIFTFLLCHWIFDFFGQTDEMAKNKSTSNHYLNKHVQVYSLGLVVMAILNFNAFKQSIDIIIPWVIINGIAHFFTDYVTSRCSSALFKLKQTHNFFLVIGIDQMIHYMTLFGTFVYFTRTI